MYKVYFLRSVNYPDQTYIGFTTDLEQRFKDHNLGKSVHTLKYRPWKLVTYVAFDCAKKAQNFEQYAKIGSGHAFAKKRFW